MEFSVIIPSYNQVHSIDRCIQSVLTQEGINQGSYEIIVVDSSPKEAQSQIENICTQSKKIKLVTLDKQTFPGTARNIGIKQAKGSIIALLDSDCLVEKKWLHHIQHYIEDNILLNGILVNGTPENIIGTCCFLIEFNTLLYPPSNSKKEGKNIDKGTGVFACKKNVFEQVGYFSEERTFEDILFVSKFKKKGGRICTVSDIRITHINKTKFSEVKKYLRLLGGNSAIVRKANNMPPKIIFKLPLLAFGLVFIRYFNIFMRLSKSHYIFPFILYTPMVLFLLFEWSKGFFFGSKSKKITE